VARSRRVRGTYLVPRLRPARPRRQRRAPPRRGTGSLRQEARPVPPITCRRGPPPRRGKTLPLYTDLATYYDRLYRGKDCRSEADQILALAHECLGRRPRSLLDVACGTGRHLAEFRRRVDAAGVDLSPRMLAVARQRVGRSVPLRRADMRDFRLGRTFDVVVCLFSAFAHMRSAEDRARALSNFYRHLVPGGAALVEGWILPQKFRDRSAHVQLYDGPDAKIVRVSTGRRRGRWSVIDMHDLVVEPGMTIQHFVEVHRNPLLQPEEVLAAFHAAGFRARVVVPRPFGDRGLYIGVRPREQGGAIGRQRLQTGRTGHSSPRGSVARMGRSPRNALSHGVLR
jgi:SAM-dependent methyltransferase